MKRINTRKRKTINIVQCSKGSKTKFKFLESLRKITSILFEVTDSLIKPLVYIFLSYREEDFENK